MDSTACDTRLNFFLAEAELTQNLLAVLADAGGGVANLCPGAAEAGRRRRLPDLAIVDKCAPRPVVRVMVSGSTRISVTRSGSGRGSGSGAQATSRTQNDMGSSAVPPVL